jgi:hypothetical protein
VHSAIGEAGLGVIGVVADVVDIDAELALLVALAEVSGRRRPQRR